MEILDLVIYCIRKVFGVKLPDCPQLLAEIVAAPSHPSPPSSASTQTKTYVWLCQLTGAGLLLRTVCVGLAMGIFFIVIFHLNRGWPPVEIGAESDKHLMILGVGDSAAQSQPFHYCLALFAALATSLVAAWGFLEAIAWLAAQMVEMFRSGASSSKSTVNKRTESADNKP